MIPSKISALCLVGFVLFANYIEARPAPEEEHEVHHVHKKGHPGGHGHTHHVHKEGHPNHVHHHGGGGDNHVHKHKVGGGGGGGTHVHHYSTGGGGGAGGAGGGAGGLGGLPGGAGGLPGGAGGLPGGAGGLPGGAGGLPGGAGGGAGADINLNGGVGGGGAGGVGGDVNINAGSGSGGLGNLNLKGFSPDTIKTFKKILGNLNVDLSQIDLNDLNLGGGGGGAAGGAAGGGGIHKYDGKDSLQPAICDDSINDRYGVGKHFVRGVRDVGAAIASEAEDLLNPFLGGLTQGVGQGLKALLCAIENGFSDFGSDFDSATDIAKHGLVNFFKLQGPHPVLGIPVGIAGIAGEAVKAAVSIGGDAVGGIGNAVHQLVSNIGKK